MSSNIVGCFDNAADAQAVQQELVSAGIPRNSVHLLAEDNRTVSQSSSQDEPGLWESIKDAFGFADDSDRRTYEEATRRGSVIVSVDAPENAIDQAVAIMQQHNVVDLDQREAQWRGQGWAGYPSAQQMSADDTSASMSAKATPSAQPGEAIPVVEEQLRVGKRAIQQGGIRIYSHVTEKPVEEQINLREERVNVERRPVDRPVSEADRAFQERSIEATEMSEQAVVEKQARVVEEVSLRKDVQDTTETVRDKVRRTDVEVEEIPGQMAGGSSSADFSDTFITDLSADARYSGRDWSAAEPDIRRSFESRYPKSSWEQFKDRIRSGFDRSRM